MNTHHSPELQDAMNVLQTALDRLEGIDAELRSQLEEGIREKLQQLAGALKDAPERPANSA